MNENNDRISFCKAMIVLYRDKLDRGVVIYPSFFVRAIKVYEEEILRLGGDLE